jgi:hypothetical protein
VVFQISSGIFQGINLALARELNHEVLIENCMGICITGQPAFRKNKQVKTAETRGVSDRKEKW